MLSSTPTKNNLPPHKDVGPRWLQFPALNFASVSSFTFDLNKELSQAQLDNIQTVYIDNSLNARAVSLLITGSNQILSVPAGSQGIFPLATTDKQNISVVTSGQGIVNLWFCNIKLDTAIWNGTSNGLAADGSVSLSGVDQIVLPYRANRLGLIIQNQGASAMAINFAAPAVLGGAGSINLPAGGQLILYGGACPCDAVHAIGTAAQNLTVKEIY